MMDHVLERIPVEWGREAQFDEGWYPLVEHLDRVIARLMPDYQIYQMKEKFGTLRFYWSARYPADSTTDERQRLYDLVSKLVSSAKLVSGFTCEWCGSLAGVRVRSTSHWLKTLCPTCAAGDDREWEVLA